MVSGTLVMNTQANNLIKDTLQMPTHFDNFGLDKVAFTLKFDGQQNLLKAAKDLRRKMDYMEVIWRDEKLEVGRKDFEYFPKSIIDYVSKIHCILTSQC